MEVMGDEVAEVMEELSMTWRRARCASNFKNPRAQEKN